MNKYQFHRVRVLLCCLAILMALGMAGMAQAQFTQSNHVQFTPGGMQ